MHSGSISPVAPHGFYHIDHSTGFRELVKVITTEATRVAAAIQALVNASNHRLDNSRGQPLAVM